MTGETRWFDAHCDWLYAHQQHNAPPLQLPLGCQMVLAVYTDPGPQARRRDAMQRQMLTFALLEQPGFLLAVEDISPMADDVEALAARGVMMASLCWNHDTPLCGGCMDGNAGITAAGRAVMADMTRAGMVLDLAHASRKTFAQALDCYPGRVCVSHAGCAGTFAHPRNLERWQVDELVARGGFWGLPLAPALLGGEALAEFGRHAAAALDWGAGEILGLGSDWCGCPRPVAPVGGPGDYHLLDESLRQVGAARGQREKILSKNAARLL